MGFCRAAHRENAAGVGLLQNGVVAVAALGVADLFPQRRTVSDHRRNAEFGILFRINGRWMDKEDRTGIFVNDVANDIVQELGFADLRRGDHRNMTDAGIGKGVHRLAEIRRALGAPRSRLCRTLRRQPAVLFRPLCHGQVCGRQHSLHRFCNELVQPDNLQLVQLLPCRRQCCLVLTIHHRHAPTSPCALSRARHTFSGHNDRSPARA